MSINRSDANNTPARFVVKLNSVAPAGPAGTGSASKQPVQSSEPSDRAQISGLGSYLASALSGSPAHAAKLSELGAAVSKGQYQVDAYAVSGSIIQSSIEFGGSSYAALST
jgi:anti-sigma28 factor (negative regulator of flagellin synthesis)